MGFRTAARVLYEDPSLGSIPLPPSASALGKWFWHHRDSIYVPSDSSCATPMIPCSDSSAAVTRSASSGTRQQGWPSVDWTCIPTRLARSSSGGSLRWTASAEVRTGRTLAVLGFTHSRPRTRGGREVRTGMQAGREADEPRAESDLSHAEGAHARGEAGDRTMARAGAERMTQPLRRADRRPPRAPLPVQPVTAVAACPPPEVAEGQRCMGATTSTLRATAAPDRHRGSRLRVPSRRAAGRLPRNFGCAGVLREALPRAGRVPTRRRAVSGGAARLAAVLANGGPADGIPGLPP